MPEFAHPLRREAKQARDADQLRQRLRLELLQLCQLAGLDELPQPRLDPRADAGELADSPGADERRDVRRRGTDQIGGTTVGAHGVMARSGEVEQRREGVESFREGGVVHD